MRQQEINVILHFPKTCLGWHHLVRRAAAALELLEQDRAGTLKGSFDYHIQMLDAEQEEAALERYRQAYLRKKHNKVNRKLQ